VQFELKGIGGTCLHLQFRIVKRSWKLS